MKVLRTSELLFVWVSNCAYQPNEFFILRILLSALEGFLVCFQIYLIYDLFHRHERRLNFKHNTTIALKVYRLRS